MKKAKILSTVAVVAVLVVCMCSMVFGYAYKAEFLHNKSVGSTLVMANTYFYQSKSKYCSIQMNYKSIICDGKYTVYLYKNKNGSRTFFDSADRAVKAKATSGSYTSRIMLDKECYYEPGLRCDGGTTMCLDCLEVCYD